MSLRNKKFVIFLWVAILATPALTWAFHDGTIHAPIEGQDEAEYLEFLRSQPSQEPPGEKTITPSRPATGQTGSGQAKDFLDYARFLYPFMLSVAAILAVLMMVFAGIQMMASVGNPGMITSAKEKISSAIFGLLLAVGSFLILRTINPNLIKLQLSPPKVTIESQTSVPGTDTLITKDELLKEGGQTPIQRATYENIIKNNPGFEGVIRNEKKESARDFQRTAQQKCVSSGGKGVAQNPGKADEYLCLK